MSHGVIYYFMKHIISVSLSKERKLEIHGLLNSSLCLIVLVLLNNVSTSFSRQRGSWETGEMEKIICERKIETCPHPHRSLAFHFSSLKIDPLK